MTDGYAWLGTTDGSDTFLSNTTYPGDTTQGDILYASADDTVSSLAKNASATRYISNTGTSNAPAWAQVDVSNGITGQVPLANGGTNANLTASNGGVFYSTATAGAILAGTATAGQHLQSGTSAAPSWTTTTYPATSTQGDIIYASANNTLSTLAKSASNYRYLGATAGTQIPEWNQVQLNGGTMGQLTLANGGTGANLTGSAGGIFYSNAGSGAILNGTATARLALLSGSSTAPSWSTYTFPASLADKDMLRANGTGTLTTITFTGKRLMTSTSAAIQWNNSVDCDFTFTDTIAAETRTLTVTNPDNTSASSQSLIKSEVGGASAGDAMFQASTTATKWTFGADNSNADAFVVSQGTALGTNDVLISTTAGSITKPLQPCFFAYLSASATDVTGDGTVYTLALNTELFDQQNNFDNTTYTFTAPVTGKYMVTVATQLLQLGALHTLVESKLVVAGTSANTYVLFSLSGAARDSNNNMIMTNSLLVPMTATDTFTVTVQATGSTKTVDVFGGVTGTSVSAHLVC